jgi:hypothetical protein
MRNSSRFPCNRECFHSCLLHWCDHYKVCAVFWMCNSLKSVGRMMCCLPKRNGLMAVIQRSNDVTHSIPSSQLRRRSFITWEVAKATTNHFHMSIFSFLPSHHRINYCLPPPHSALNYLRRLICWYSLAWAKKISRKWRLKSRWL